MSERVPILHLVVSPVPLRMATKREPRLTCHSYGSQGVPSTALQAKKAILHHTLGGAGNFNSFATMSSHISSAVGILKKEGNWTEEIDRVLTVALTECRPVYLTLPTDLVHAQVSDERLKKHALPRPHSAPPARESESQTEGTPSSDVLKFCIDEIKERFAKSKKPIVIVDICADRFGCGPELKRLVEATEVRFFASESSAG